MANRKKMGTEIDSLSCPKIRHPDFSPGIRPLNVSFQKANRLFQGMAGRSLGTFIQLKQSTQSEPAGSPSKKIPRMYFLRSAQTTGPRVKVFISV